MESKLQCTLITSFQIFCSVAVQCSAVQCNATATHIVVWNELKCPFGKSNTETEDRETISVNLRFITMSIYFPTWIYSQFSNKVTDKMFHLCDIDKDEDVASSCHQTIVSTSHSKSTKVFPTRTIPC